MRRVLAALDSSPTAPSVLDAAVDLGRLAGATVEAVHVTDAPAGAPPRIAGTRGISCRVLTGEVGEALLGEVDAPDVVAAVIGSRSQPDDSRPAGQTALRVLEQSAKPVLVVPPGVAARPHHVRRVLMPFEGGREASSFVLDQLGGLLRDQVDLVVLHVFTGDTAPRMLDRPGPDLAMLSSEFGLRHCPAASVIDLRAGAVPRRIDEVCTDERADLIVLSWSQSMAPGHAAVVRSVLADALVPVLLLPVPTPAVPALALGRLPGHGA